MNPLAQILDAVMHLRAAPEFIKTYKVWQGYWESGWLARTTVILAAIITIFFIMDINQGVQDLISPLPEHDSASLATLMDKVYFDGGVKYLILIILEMLIFHFSVRTLDILNGTKTQTTPKDFIDAQIRMIKVSVRNYIQEIILGTAAGIILGIVSMGWLKGLVLLLLQFYFIGFAFMDNYYEQNNITIKESAKYIRNHLYAATVIGGAGYLLFMVPLLGALLGPFICAVAATTYLHFKSGREEEFVRPADSELAI